MSNKSVVILAAVTIVVVALATLLNASPARSEGADVPDRLVPTLEDRVNDVAAISIARGETDVRLARSEGVWRVEPKDGYPAKLETVKRLILAVAEIEPIERKTSDPDMLARVGLAEPGPESASTRVTLRDEQGAALADVILGDRSRAGGASRRFVRRADEQQAWLADTRVAPPTDAMGWIEREIMRIPQARVSGVRVDHPDAPDVVVELADPETPGSYELRDIPQGRQPQPGAAGRLAGAIGYVALTDVRARPAGAPPPGAVTTTYTLTSGLILDLTTWTEGDRTWLTVDATPAPPPGAAGEDEEAGGFDLSTDEAEDLTDRLSLWAFEIDQPKADSLRVKMEDLTEPAEEAEAPAEADEG